MESVSESAAQRRAEELLAACQSLLDAHSAWQRRTLLMRLDRPGVTVLRGKARWQVMFKLLVHPDAEAFAAALSELARTPQPQVDTYFEYNPTTMM